MSNLEVINVGTLPNDGEGDPLRVAFQKINNNFTILNSVGYSVTDAATIGNTAAQVIFTYPANTFTQGMFQIKSYNEDTNDSQDIMLQAQLLNDGSAVKFTGYGTSFNGNTVVSSYDMIIDSGNVVITVDPTVNSSSVLQHFISYQITYAGIVTGAALTLEGSSGDTLVTEGGIIITTES